MLEDGKKGALLTFLFERKGVVVRNVKFFRGARDLISEEEFCHEVHSALMQERMGKAAASASFEDATPTVNVQELVATL